MPEFIPGLVLSQIFFEEAVRPLLDQHAPDLAYAAARLGSGSDVLGYDTPMSTDHDWGPRLSLFLPQAAADQAGDLTAMLDRALPATIRGFPVRFAPSDGSRPAGHWVEVTTLHAFVAATLGFDLNQPLTAADWLSFPRQRLLSLTAGQVYHDGVGELTTVRERFAFYPRDVWYYVMAAGWQRLGQEGHLMPRAGIVGDEPGAALIGARMVRDLMSLAFLLERQYAPYAKWFGTAFARLACAPQLAPLLERALRATGWQERNEAVVAAGEMLVRRHNALGITPPVPALAARFHDRPFEIIQPEPIIAALQEQVTDPAVHSLFRRRLIGNIDQISDNTDLLEDIQQRPVIRDLYLDRDTEERL